MTLRTNDEDCETDGNNHRGKATMTPNSTPTSAKPLCPHFSVCGGCQTQHLTYEQQLENKRIRLASLLKAHYTGRITVHANEQYGYRNRMDFVFGQGEGRTPTVGFRKAEGGGLVAVNECPIAEKSIAQTAQELRSWLADEQDLEIFDHKRRSGALKYATVRTANEGNGVVTSVIIMLSEDSTRLAHHIDALERFAKRTSAQNVIVAYTPASVDESLSTEYSVIKGEEYLHERFCDETIEYHALAFFQNNPRVAEDLVRYVKDALLSRGAREHTIIDAYGGVGTFGLVLAPHVAAVVSIESHPLSSACATRNAERRGLTNFRAITDDAANTKKYALPKGSFYLLDPPRSGMSEKALRAVLASESPVIVYVSCNPSVLTKELVLLSQRYHVTQVALFDMFPQTNHIESVAVLERRT
jgi:23S rRNA (uracil-5-)-methyltransferase RumA